MTDVFSSDLHDGHANIIKYCDRPYPDVEVMLQATNAEWASKVTKKDRVFLLGDLGMGFRKSRMVSIYAERIAQAKEVHWMLGNHDDYLVDYKPFRDLFTSVQHVKEIKSVASDQSVHKIFMSHYAHRVWNGSHKGVIHLYGHSHGSLPDDPNALSWDVGVDNNDQKFLTIDDIVKIMSKKTYKPIDHHGDPNRKYPTNG